MREHGAFEKEIGESFEREEHRDAVPDDHVLCADGAGKGDAGVQHGVSHGDRVLFRHTERQKRAGGNVNAPQQEHQRPARGRGGELPDAAYAR